MMKRASNRLLREGLRGAASGLFASWVMGKAQGRIQQLGSEETKQREREVSDEPATYKVARAAVRPLGVVLSEEQAQVGGEIVHYAYGGLWGATFALLEERARLPFLLAGVAFGALLWLASDELLVPLVGFSRKPTAYPASTHLKALAAHCVYGLATDGSYRLLKRIA